MIRSMLRGLFLFVTLLALCGFTGQPPEERKAQDALPKSRDTMWQVLGKTKIRFDEKRGFYLASYPAEVKALAGKQITISGFILPVEAGEKFSHFILTRRTPTCAFCMPGEPDEIIDVWLEKPIAWDEGMVKVTGTLELMNNQELAMFFKIKNAKAQR